MIYLLELVNKEQKYKISFIETIYNNLNEKEQGVLELFWELESYGKCETYSKIRVLYVAYLLEKNKINTRVISK